MRALVMMIVAALAASCYCWSGCGAEKPDANAVAQPTADLIFVQSGKTRVITSPKESAYPGKKWLEETVTAKNVTNNVFFVSGHSLEHVFVGVSTKDPVKNEWVSRGLGYCGTGASLHPLKPGESFSATVDIPIELSAREYRIDVEVYSGANASEPRKMVSSPLRMRKPDVN